MHTYCVFFQAFQLFDFNCDGIIDLEDLKFTFITVGKPDVSEEQLQRMLSEIPTPIDFDAFITLFGWVKKYYIMERMTWENKINFVCVHT